MSERTLWQEVLLRQIADARLEPSSWPIPQSAHQETTDARQYLTTPSEGLTTVCALAGVDMQALLKRMKVQVAEVPMLEQLPADAAPKRTRGALLEHDGRRLPITRWAEVTGIPESVIRNRISQGWTVADALTIPKRTRA